MANQLIKKIKITGVLELISGLHIGDSSENSEIGAVDSPIVRRKDNNQPYIPGSSLKGKMRCLLEQREGIINCDNKAVGQLFGFFKDKQSDEKGHPSRIIVRDAYLTNEWVNKLKNSDHTDMPFTEIKFENVINRVKGTAEHPRQIERIPAGAKFNIEYIINIFDDSNEAALLKLFYDGIELLQLDYLGGSGTRGYGQVKISLDEKKDIDLTFKALKNEI